MISGIEDIINLRFMILTVKHAKLCFTLTFYIVFFLHLHHMFNNGLIKLFFLNKKLTPRNSQLLKIKSEVYPGTENTDSDHRYIQALNSHSYYTNNSDT